MVRVVAPLEAVVHTGAEVTVLGMVMFNRLQEKPPIRRPVTTCMK